MNTTLIASMFLVIIVMGAYIGISGLAQQYSIAPGNSQAESIICAPQAATAVVGQSIRWNTSGIPTGTRYHWASDEGRSEVNTAGSFFVAYSKPGTKTAHLFYEIRSRWYESSCTITIK